MLLIYKAVNRMCLNCKGNDDSDKCAIYYADNVLQFPKCAHVAMTWVDDEQDGGRERTGGGRRMEGWMDG